MSSNVELRNLPLDGIRPILSFLDLTSLVKLFATFDRKIQRLLSAPGAFTYLRILPIVTVPRAPLRYFLMSVNNVSHLEFANGVKWAAPTLSLLKTLNPRRLSLGTEFLHPSVSSLLEDLAKNPKDEHLRRLAQFITPNRLPDFAQLTPRLEALEAILGGILLASNYVEEQQQDLLVSLPASVVSVELDCDSLDLSSLPPTLLSLTLNTHSVDFALICSRFQSLQSLVLSAAPSTLLSDPIEPIPPSLHTISIEGHFKLLSKLIPHLKTSKIAEATVLSFQDSLLPKEVQPILLSEALPETLKSLTVDMADRPHLFKNFPTQLSRLSVAAFIKKKKKLDAPLFPERFWHGNSSQLEELTIQMRCQLTSKERTELLDHEYTGPDLEGKEPGDEDEEAVQDLERRQKEKGIYVGVPAPFIPLKSLPASLKKLSFEKQVDSVLTKDEIVLFPSSLTFLSIPHLPLEHFDTFREAYPLCVVHLTAPIRLLGSVDGLFLLETFSEHFVPVLDPNAFAIALNQYYGLRKLFFRLNVESQAEMLDHDFGRSIKWLDVKTVFFRRSTFVTPGAVAFDPNRLMQSPNLKFLCIHAQLMDVDMNDHELSKNSLRLPPVLTRINFHDSITFLSPVTLPETLTWLSARATCSMISSSDSVLTSPWPCRLKVLDTPGWTLSGHNIGYLRDLEVFNVKFEQIADYNVVELLTNAVSRKTRLNMKIDIVYDVTGSLVPDDEVNGVKDIDWKEMRAITEKVLKRLMASPMPACKPGDIGYNADAEEIPDDTIGRVLSSLEPAQTHRMNTPICIPYSATSANLSVKREWILVSNMTRSPEDKANHMKKQYPSRDALEYDTGSQLLNIFNRPSMSVESCPLVRLTLGNCGMRTAWFDHLPPSLRYLHVSTDEFTKFKFVCPPRLEVLILEPFQRHKGETPFLFPLDSMSPSIRHMAIMTAPTKLDAGIEGLSNTTKLVNLKTFLCNLVAEPFLRKVYRLTLLNQLERIEAEEIVTDELKSQFGNLKPSKSKDSKTPPISLASYPGLKIMTKVDFSALMALPTSTDEQTVTTTTPKLIDAPYPSTPASISDNAENPSSSVPNIASSVFPTAAPRKKAVRVPRK